MDFAVIWTEMPYLKAQKLFRQNYVGSYFDSDNFSIPPVWEKNFWLAQEFGKNE